MLIVQKTHFSHKSARYNRDGKYAFIVHKAANKIQIKKALSDLYNVQVEEVRTMNYPAKKLVRYTKKGLVKGAKKSYKKAVVALRKGDKIDVHNQDQ